MQNKNFPKFLFFSLFLFIFAEANGQTRVMGMEDCINYALTNHPDVKVAELALKDADWQIKESKSTGMPQFSGGVDYQYFIQRPGIPQSALFPGGSDEKVYFSANHTLAPSLAWDQLFYSRSYGLALRGAQVYRDYAQAGLALTRQNIRFQVIYAYLPTLVITEGLGIIDKNISSVEKLLNETKAINKAGFAEQLDVDRLELSLSTLQTDRSNLLRQYEIVVNALKFSMGMPVKDSIVLADNLDTLLARYVYTDLTSEVNFMNRAEYVQLLKARDLNALNIDLNSKVWIPTFRGFLQYSPTWQGGFGDDTRWFFIPSSIVGVSVSFTIWDGGTSKAKRERARLDVQQIDEQKRTLENAITLEVENARRQYLSAEERVNNLRRNLTLAERIYDTTQKKYRAGVGSSFEVTQAEQSLYIAQKNLIDALYDFLLAKSAVRKALGIL
jgi:outer membrane protein TolC